MQRRALPLLAALLIAGCGGSGHHGSSTSSSGTTLQSGVASLNQALTSDGDRTESLQRAQKAFDAAYAKSPDDPRVALGYGLSTVALAADALGASLDVRAAKRPGLLGGLGQRLGVQNHATLAPVRRSRAEGGDDLADLRAQLGTVLARLTAAKADALEADPLTLAYGGDGGIQVNLGAVEAYALRSAVEAALGRIDLALAYGLATDEDLGASFATAYAAQIAAGAVLAPADYLPGGEYGKRQPGYAALLAETAAALDGTADDGNAALARLAARTGTGYLSDLVPLTGDQKAEIKAKLDLLKASLNGGASVPLGDSGATVTLDLRAFLSNAPADLRAFYPSLTPSATALTPVAGSVADPTYGGLVPGGVPAPALYGRTIPFDEGTTRQEVLDGAFPLSSLLSM